jgi:hypothetical protein
MNDFEMHVFNQALKVGWMELQDRVVQIMLRPSYVKLNTKGIP